jgi:hypothetical protein
MNTSECLFEEQIATREDLVQAGKLLDRSPRSLEGRTVFIELAEQLLFVRTKDGRTNPLRANAVQQLFEQRRGEKNIVLKARQMGLTTWTAARFFLKTITHPGTMTVQVAHTQDAAEEIFRMVHRFLDWLPEELREGPLKTSRLNARQIIFPEIDSQYRVVSAGDRNAGRGWTIQNLHCSELARWPLDPAEILAGLRAALVPGAEVILESTPEGAGGCFYDEWKKADETATVRHFFPWWLEARYRSAAVDVATLTEEESKLIELYDLDLKQIGYRRHLHSSFHGLAKQEYAEDAESCFLASGESIFEREPLEKRILDAPEPSETRRNGALRIWLPALRGKKYLLALDPAGGGSDGDYSAAQVIDMETGMQCAEFAAHMGGVELAEYIAMLASEFNQAWLVVERNNHGSGILALLESVCRYPKLFRQSGQPGWLTGSVSRPAMLSRMNAALVEKPELFMSRELLAECRTFVRLPDGNTGARAGTHDDRVMAMAIGLAARNELLASSC